MEAPDTDVDALSLSTVAKFKATQDLRIETNLADLPTSPPSRSTRSTSSSSLRTPGTDTASASTPTPKTPATSTGKKRRRRTAAQIDRKFPCTYAGCTKAYGSEGSLTQHQRLKHRHQALEQRSPPVHQHQVGSLLLPLHRAPRSVPGGSTSTAFSLPRTVHIRPASLLDPGLMSIPLDLPPELAPSPTDTEQHQQLRVRSNSMPISFSASPTVVHYSLGFPEEAERRTKLNRTSLSPSPNASLHRTSVSPSSGPTLSLSPSLSPNPNLTSSSSMVRRRSAKSRSNSESLPSLPLLSVKTEREMVLSDRSMSDPILFHPLNAIEWGDHVGDGISPPSGSEEAIDSDILSVLADYDSSEEGEASAPMEFSTSDSFLLATSISPPTVAETTGTAALSATFAMDEDWGTQPDAMFLSSHLEKMSMVPGAAAPISGTIGEDAKMVDTSTLRSIPMPDHLTPGHAAVHVVPPPTLSPLDSKSPHPASAIFTTLSTHHETTIEAALWGKDDMSDSESIGHSDLDVDMYLVPDARLEPATTWKSDKLFGAFPLLDDSFLPEHYEAAMDEARLSSPVLSEPPTP